MDPINEINELRQTIKSLNARLSMTRVKEMKLEKNHKQQIKSWKEYSMIYERKKKSNCCKLNYLKSVIF